MVAHAFLCLRCPKFVKWFDQRDGPAGYPQQFGERLLLTTAIGFNGVRGVHHVDALIRKRDGKQFGDEKLRGGLDGLQPPKPFSAAGPTDVEPQALTRFSGKGVEDSRESGRLLAATLKQGTAMFDVRRERQSQLPTPALVALGIVLTFAT